MDAGPAKFALGVNVISPVIKSSETAPLIGADTAVRDSVSPSASESFDSRDDDSITDAVSSGVDAVSSAATGASLAGVTVTVTSPVSDNVPSDNVYSNDAGPAKFAVGVNVISPVIKSSETAPLIGADTAVRDSASPSASESFDSRDNDSITDAVSSGVDAVSSAATGASLAGVTVTVTSPVS